MPASPSITVAIHADPIDALGEVLAEGDALLRLTVAGLEFAQELVAMGEQDADEFDAAATCDRIDQFIDVVASSLADHPGLRTPEWEARLAEVRFMAAALRAEYAAQ